MRMKRQCLGHLQRLQEEIDDPLLGDDDDVWDDVVWRLKNRLSISMVRGNKTRHGYPIA